MKFKILIIICLGLTSFHVSNAGITITNGLSHTFNVEPGKTYTGKIGIQNVGSTIQLAEFKQTDLGSQADGTALFSDSINPLRSNRSWIVIYSNNTPFNPKQTVFVQFEILVPADTTLKGTYWSVIMVEPVNPIDTNAKKAGFRIQTTTRYAIHIICNFGNIGIGELEFQKPGLVIDEDKTFFDFVLLNTGEHIITPVVSMELFDAETGESVKIIKIPVKKIFPTTIKKLRLPLEGVPKKKTYKVVIVADGSGNDVFGIETTLEL